MIRGGGINKAVVIGAEKLHHWLDFTNRDTAVLFGDGAGAVVVEATDEPVGLLSYELGSDGSLADILCITGSGTAGDASKDKIAHLIMDGKEVFRRAVVTMGDAAVRVVEKAELTLEDVDLLIPHQANVRIIDATARRLKLQPEQVFVNIASYGNTSAATIPIALTEALEEGRIEPGANIVFARVWRRTHLGCECAQVGTEGHASWRERCSAASHSPDGHGFDAAPTSSCTA